MMANRNDETLRELARDIHHDLEEAVLVDCDGATKYKVRQIILNRLRAATLTPRPEPAGRVECRECKDTGVFYWHDGPTKRAATCPCRRRAAHAPQEGAE